MTDIVERLRAGIGPQWADDDEMARLLRAAAAEIERLRQIIDSVWPQMQAGRDNDRAEIERLRDDVARLTKLLQPSPEQKAQADVGRKIWEDRQ